ncbi:sulfoquinovosidase-like isoform X1 [Apostichopus japonicus]|uniref:sulfoquinovosidase-like isoform X1 n=2 Tax=Stichopus japonicus TaxID=307972 RepID=UPI003AB832AC
MTVTVLITDAGGLTYITLTQASSNFNRFWFRIMSTGSDEHVYGGGEQFSYVDLNGRNYPLWLQEQGVGRNKSTYTTFLADQDSGSGGDYYSTYWVQPTFVSSRKYFAHFTSSTNGQLDFRNDGFHEVEIWNAPDSEIFPGQLVIGTATTFPDLLTKLTGLLGRQPKLPDWLYNGVILGVQGGTEAMLGYLEQAQNEGMKVAGLWIQDYAGRITTSFGRRLFWNWQWDPEQYPDLDTEIIRLKEEENIRLFAYMNPNLNREGNMFVEAEDLGYLIRNSSGQTYLIDYGEFFCGIVDLTSPEAFDWYKAKIKTNMIEFGFDGWMADFGEYLPPAVFDNGVSGEEMHNLWPVLWAKANREAVEEAGRLGDIVFWMRAGFTGSQNYSVMTWSGDQLVDFSTADGLASVITGTLSLGMSGYGLNHFDIGGYTSLYGVIRTEELLLRYAELAAFTPMMRSHEGNRPDENWQYYSSVHSMKMLGRATEIYILMRNYTQSVLEEVYTLGYPAQRPLFFHYDNDPLSFDDSMKYQYLLGKDILVAPVYLPSSETGDRWTFYLPPDDWVYLWDGTAYDDGGEYVTVDAPLGTIPVFYRKDSTYAQFFQNVAANTPAILPTTTMDPVPTSMASIASMPSEFVLIVTFFLVGKIWTP